MSDEFQFLFLSIYNHNIYRIFSLQTCEQSCIGILQLENMQDKLMNWMKTFNSS